MKLKDLPVVDPIARRWDRLTDELKKLDQVDLLLGTFEGGGDKLSLQLTAKNPLFGVLKACVVNDVKAQIAKTEDELRALGVEP